MLPFANTMFLDLLHEDGLLVAAKGLGIEEVFYSLLRVYSDPGNLVLVMGTDEDEENYFMKRLEMDDVKMLPKKVTTEYSIPERQKLYLDGGVLFVTTRIMVVDMLTDRMPMSLVTGVLVYKAHNTLDSCQESFVLRLFRQKNKTGFVKAFSSSPVSFKTGLTDMSRLMKTLYVKELYLWPRFHLSVVETLSACSPEVIELHVDMTPMMRTIQTSVLDLINFSLSELRRLNPNLLVDDLTVENAISRSFHKMLLRELEPIWHRLSWKTKQLVTDIKTLHSVLVHLTQYDCVTFHIFVSGLRTTENAMKSAGWMLLDAAETLFLTARSRVYGPEDAGKTKKQKTEDGEDKLFKFDVNPKWSALTEIMTDIRKEIEDNQIGDEAPDAKTLILTSDFRVAHQIEDFLYLGTDALLTRMATKTILSEHLPEKRREFKHIGRGKKSTPTVTIVDRADLGAPSVENVEGEGVEVTPPGMPIVKSLQSGSFYLYKLFEELRPRYVVLYDVEMGVVRQLEVFQASHPSFKIKVFFLMYSNSVEEQAYLTSLRREKEAFEFLIKEKGSLVLPDLVDEDFRVEADNEVMNNSISRKAGGSLASSGQVSKVIVDMREFRSELPSILHKRGIQVDPVTLEVGDYILTPEICVERKSISDLIGSLNCGRLYNQATAMSRFYAKPMLLIEFDQNKPFALQGKYYLSRDISSSDITARLQLLTIHFPKLRILWSPSPHATGELFEELKKGREEPDPAKAAGVTIDAADEFNSDKYNPTIMDFLSKLPGITTKNIFALMNRLENMHDLLEQSLEDLTEILGHSSNAKDLYECLHENLCPLDDQQSSNSNKAKQKGSRFKSEKTKSQVAKK